jgi:predicted amidohydrolase YtcJ
VSRPGQTLFHHGQVHAPDFTSGTTDSLVVDGSTIVAVGEYSELSDGFPGAQEVDLQGRVLVPGLIDGHIHAVRGGATWTRELHWEGMRRQQAAIDDIRLAVEGTPAGTWLLAVGGWHSSQFGGWVPTPEELSAVAPTHPVYVQSLYEIGIANARAIELASATLNDVPGVSLDDDGRPTGHIEGIIAYTAILSAAGQSSLQQEAEGTRALFSTLGSLGITGVVDAGGFGMSEDRYAAIHHLHDKRKLDVRARLYLSAVTRGEEIADAEANLIRLRQQRPDDYLRAVGIGEIVHFGCHDFEGLDDTQIAASTSAQLEQISWRAAEAGFPLHVHAVTDEVADFVLTVWERIAKTLPIRRLRFSLAHGDLLGQRSIARMAELGVGLVLDSRQAFRAGASIEAWGEGSMSSVPPIKDLLSAGITLGLGTDATRASSFNPWLALWWLVAGKSFGGASQRSAEHLLDRHAALAIATSGNAWFTKEESRRGAIREGYLADFAVLDRDYFSIDIDEIPDVTSDLTVMGGRVTHSSGALAPATTLQPARH